MGQVNILGVCLVILQTTWRQVLEDCIEGSCSDAI